MNKFLFFLISLCSFVYKPLDAQNYSEDIAPIIYSKCTNCHRPGEIGPFSLTNYQEVKNWAYTIKYVTAIGYMPPWKPDIHYQNFQKENVLTTEQIQDIADWVDKGMPQGDPSKEPQLPTFPTGSQIGKPDLVLSFSQSYTHKGNGKDEYRYFVIPTNLTEDKNLIALEMRPGNKKIVHHTLFWADNTGKARQEDAKTPEYGFSNSPSGVLTGNQLPGYVPGQKPNVYSNGMSQVLPKGSDLVLQMHYAPTSLDETDSSTINLFFAKNPAPRQVYSKILLPTDLVNGPFIIAPGAKPNFHAVYKVPVKVSLLGIWPHCHMLGKKWEVYAKLPDGSTINLIRINEWDFNWQGGYYFNSLIVLPPDTEIHAYCSYDNTEDNPTNPNNPPKYVTWGEGTADEMFYLPLSFVFYQAGDENITLDTDQPNFHDQGFEQLEDRLEPVAPNPVTTRELNTTLVLSKDQNVEFKLFDEKGSLLGTLLQPTHYLQGQHQVNLKLPVSKSGIYFIQANLENRILVQKFLVSN